MTQEDSYFNRIYLESHDVTVETSYRIGFDADRTCGFSRVYSGKHEKPSEDDEIYEIYMELYDCGLNKEQVQEKEKKIVDEIKTGKLDVSF